jgi:hypothetical protein
MHRSAGWLVLEHREMQPEERFTMLQQSCLAERALKRKQWDKKVSSLSSGLQAAQDLVTKERNAANDQLNKRLREIILMSSSVKSAGSQKLNESLNGLAEELKQTQSKAANELAACQLLNNELASHGLAVTSTLNNIWIVSICLVTVVCLGFGGLRWHNKTLAAQAEAAATAKRNAPPLLYDMQLRLPIKRRSDMHFEDPTARRGRHATSV